MGQGKCPVALLLQGRQYTAQMHFKHICHALDYGGSMLMWIARTVNGCKAHLGVWQPWKLNLTPRMSYWVQASYTNTQEQLVGRSQLRRICTKSSAKHFRKLPRVKSHLPKSSC